MGVAGKAEMIRQLDPLPGASAFSADDLTGHGVTVLIFVLILMDALFQTVCIDDGICRLKCLMADDRFMVVPCKVLRSFTSVDVAIESVIGVGLLHDHIACVLFIAYHAVYRMPGPSAIALGSDTLLIQFSCNSPRRHAGKDRLEYPPHRFSLLFIDHHLTIHVVVTVWRIANLEGTILETFLNAPLVVFRNGVGFALRQA